jgi:hypothetical protein
MAAARLCLTVTTEALMQIHIYTDRSDKRLFWTAVTVVGLVLAWNAGTIYVW